MAVGEARVPLLHGERPAPAHHVTEKAVDHRTLGGGATVVTSLIAGASAGALAKTTIAPLDRTKINFQTSQTPYSWRAAVNFLVQSAKTEGFLALWRGNSATMARIVPYAAIQFTAHEQWKRVLNVDTPQAAQQHRIKHLVAGSLAGVTSQSATYPLDMARARMAVTNALEYRTLGAVFTKVIKEEGFRALYRTSATCSGVTSQSATYPLDMVRARMAVTNALEYRTLGNVFTKVIKEEGFRALYRGYPATVMGVIPYAGVSFFTYDTVKHMYFDKFGGTRNPFSNMIFGGAAGAVAQTASYPLDIVRRRMQTARRGPDGLYHCRTIADTISYVYRTEGLRGFFKGLSMNWVKGPIAVGISFATYDAIKSTLRDLALALNR